MSTPPLRIGSWPGYNARHNPFMGIFLEGLAETGAEIVSYDSVEALLAADTDVVIIHWAETVLRQSKDRWRLMANVWQLKKFFAKRPPARPKIIWLAHNLEPHRQKRLQQLLWPSYMRALTTGVDGVLTLAPDTIKTVCDALPVLTQTPIASIWHPRYPAPQGDAAQARTQARASTGFDPDTYVFGYCGQITPYKGIDLALEAFTQTTAPHLRFYLAGKSADPDLVAQISALAARDPRIVTHFSDLSPHAFETALLCCDTVVAPFRNYLHSGSMIHALSLGCRIVTPTAPFANSMATLLGSNHVETYTGLLTSAMLEDYARRPHGTPADLSALDPAAVAAQTLAFIDTI